MMARRRALDGSLPERVVRTKMFASRCATQRRDRVRSPTCSRAPARRCRRPPRPRSPGCCATCCAIPTSAPRVVPIIPDEARTFGLDALFREFKIYAPFGQHYEPVDAELLLSYREAQQRPHPRGGDHRGRLDGVVHRRGHVVRDVGPADDPVLHLLFDVRVPARRRPDLVVRRPARPRLPARRHRRPHHARPARGCSTATARASCSRRPYPNCRAYDPAFAYEMGVIVRDGIERMYGPEPEDCFYYLTLYNENYSLPAMPEGVEEGIVRGLYRFRDRARADGHPHRRRSSPAAPRCSRALDAQQMLADEYDVAADVWSATSYKLLREDALSAERWNRLHPTEPARTPYVTEQLADSEGPDRRGDRLHEGGARPDRALRAPAVRRRSAPTATASPTPASRCAATSRSTRRTSWSRCSTGSRRPETIKGEVVADAIARFEIDPDKRRPPPHLDPSIRHVVDPRVYDVLGGSDWRSVRWPGARLPSTGRRRGGRRPTRRRRSSSSSSSASASRSTSARVPEPSRNRPSSKPCFSSRASRNRRARPFLGTSSPALQDSESSLHR